MKKEYVVQLYNLFPRVAKGYYVIYNYDGSVITDVKVTRIGGLGSGYMSKSKYHEFKVVPAQKTWRYDTVGITTYDLISKIKILIGTKSDKIKSATCVQSSLIERTDGVQKVNTGSFVIGSIVSGVLKLGTEPKFHDSLQTARKEAERLASVAPGTEFIVLRVDGKVKASGLMWS